MFTNIKNVLMSYIADVDAMKEVFLEQKKRCYEKEELTTVFKDKMFAEIKSKYDLDRSERINQANKELDSAFAEIMTKLEAAVTEDIGQDAIAELQVLTEMSVSDFEINAYAKRFAGKYKALKLINNAAKKANIPFSYVSDTKIVDELNDLKSNIMAFIREYHGGLLSLSMYSSQTVFMCLTNSVSEDKNIFNIIEAEFNNFMSPTVTVETDD